MKFAWREIKSEVRIFANRRVLQKKRATYAKEIKIIKITMTVGKKIADCRDKRILKKKNISQ